MLIKTAHFTIKALNPASASLKYLSWLADEDTAKFLKTSHSAKQSLNSLRDYIEKKTKKSNVEFYGIYENEINHIGNIKYEPIVISQHATMGILIGEKDWQGKGVAVEIIPVVNLEVCKKFELKKILLGVDIRNEAAVKAYKKCGFQFVKKSDSGQNEKFEEIMEWYP